MPPTEVRNRRRCGSHYSSVSIVQTPTQSDLPSTSRRFLPLLTALFVGSGCSALIYEVVWLQSLQLVIGSSAVSLGVLLGTFMGGMCLGSLILPRVVSVRRHPLRVYALIELGIGIAGIVLLFAMPYVDQLYAAHVRPGPSSVLLRGAVCAMCLLPPTLLMGATLPAIARWVQATPQGISWLGFFYGSNIAGAVFGCLLAGFYLLRVHDGAIATCVAATLNLTVASIALVLAGRTAHQAPVGRASPHDAPTASEDARPAGAGIVYVVIALSGFSALGAEVVWTRILSLLLGGTVYTFSIILAVFLVGLGIGSGIGSVLSRQSLRPRAALGGCQLLLTGAVAWAAYVLAKSLPYWPIDPSLSWSPWVNFQLDLMRCVWAVLPGAILWGASFPLALASAVCSVPVRASEEVSSFRLEISSGDPTLRTSHFKLPTFQETPDGVTTNEPGRLVGGVYAANTVGAIVGSLAFSMVLIPRLGTRDSQRVMIAVAAVAALLSLASPLRAWWGGGPKSWMRWAALAVVPMLAVPLVWSVPTIPAGLVCYGRYLASRTEIAEAMYVGEGMNATIAVTLLSDGVVSFHVCGKVEASTEPADMRLQRMLGHIAALLHPKPRSILVVGCGAGVTAGSFVLHPDVERIVLCEIEPLIPKVAAGFFSKENNNVLSDPRVEIVYDDARHYILTTQEKFDVITSDPIHPWVRGSAALYTREYFELCKRHLNPGGVVTQWVPLYESSADVVKSEMATFFAAFPYGTIWSNDIRGEGYDVVLLGQMGPMQINVDELQKRLQRQDYLAVAASLSEVRFASAMDLLSTYAGRGPDLEPWLEGAQINTDRNLRLQYLAGMDLNANQGAPIYNEILSYRKFPEELFTGSPERRLQLRAALVKPR
jgi:spermidine synthase